MEIKSTTHRTAKALFMLFVLGVMTACGGGGGGSGGNDGNQLSDVAKYTGLTTKATITTANAVTFTSDAFAAGGIGSSADILGKMVPRDTSGDTVTLPEIATLVKATLSNATAKKAAAQAVVGVASSNTLYGAEGGTAVLAVNVDDVTGNFTGTVTFSSFKEVATGPSLSGVVSLSGLYNKTTSSYDTLSMTFNPLTAITAKGATDLYGTFTFTLAGTTETLKMSCTLHVSTGTYWIKDWTYTLTNGNTLTVTGFYYHPRYGFVEIGTPWRLLVTSISATPTSGILQAAGVNCTRARLSFTATGSTVTAIVEGSEGWVTCTE